MYSEFQLNSLLWSISGGTTIASAISFLNNTPPGMKNMAVGAGLFSAGWAQIIASFRDNETRDEKHKNHLTILSLIAMMSAMAVRMLVDNKQSIKKIIPAVVVFMMSWLVIGKMIGTKKTEEGEEKTSNIGLVSPLLIFASMFIVNRIERPRKIVSGMGMSVFQLAWVVLSLVNSMK